MSLKTFVPYKDRGTWSSSGDFVFACICNAFQINIAKVMIFIPTVFFGGITSIIVVLVYSLLYAIPVIFLPSFLGQFSHSGFISAFRIAPLFKGLGYFALALNVLQLGFYGIFTAVPLLFLIYSFQTHLPWSCESAEYWLKDETNFNPNCRIENYTWSHDEIMNAPSINFFTSHVKGSYSFILFGLVLAVWTAVAFVLLCKTERIGRILKYCAISIITCLVVLFIGMSSLPGVKEGLANEYSNYGGAWFDWSKLTDLVSMLLFISFCPGWGSILSLASYNTFRTNLSKSSWIIWISQFGVLVLTTLLCQFSKYHLKRKNPRVTEIELQMQWMPFVNIPSSLASLPMPHLWTWIFLIMLIVGGFSLLLVQVFSVFTAVFDEFEKTRPHRSKVIFGTASIMILVSGAICSDNVVYLTEIAANLCIPAHAFLNLCLFIAVLWIYGRDRFQHDIQFMTNQVLSVSKIFVLKFITTLLLIAIVILGSNYALSTLRYKIFENLSAVYSALVALSFSILPCFCCYRLRKAKGGIAEKFESCTRPSDWCPGEAEEKLQYEATEYSLESS